MKSSTKKLLYFAFILAVLLIILIIGIKSGDFLQSMQAILNIPMRYVIAAVLCTFAVILMQSFSTISALKVMNSHISLPQMFAISLLGEFYSYVTPGASGGQPMQVYAMHKKGISAADATTALVIHYMCYHSVILILDIVFFVIYKDFVTEHIGANIVFLVIGFFFNLLLVVIATLLSFYQRPIRWVLNIAVRIMNKLHIGDPEKLRVSVDRSADNFYNGMRVMIRHKAELARQMVFGALRLLFLMSVMYFVYRGLGLHEASFGKLLALNVMQYTSVMFTPLPGSSGAQEGLFSLYFERLFPDELLFSGLLAWRFITYYLVLIVGFIVTSVLGMGSRKVPEEAIEEVIEEAHAEEERLSS